MGSCSYLLWIKGTIVSLHRKSLHSTGVGYTWTSEAKCEPVCRERGSIWTSAHAYPHRLMLWKCVQEGGWDMAVTTTKCTPFFRSNLPIPPFPSDSSLDLFSRLLTIFVTLLWNVCLAPSLLIHGIQNWALYSRWVLWRLQSKVEPLLLTVQIRRSFS